MPKSYVNDFLVEQLTKVLNEKSELLIFTSESQVKLMRTKSGKSKMLNLICLDLYVKHQFQIERFFETLATG